jgi:hypothetical protein
VKPGVLDGTMELKNAYVADPCPGWQQIIIIIPMIIARAMWAEACM